MIEVNDLHKSFGKVKVLNGIHLEYHPGKIYGLVGENGAGKTTLFNCIMGIYDYTGSITKSKTLKTGYLSASNFFYSQITGLEHLEFCMKAKDLPVNTPTIQHLNEIPIGDYEQGSQLLIGIFCCCKTMTYLFLTSRSMGWT